MTFKNVEQPQPTIIKEKKPQWPRKKAGEAPSKQVDLSDLSRPLVTFRVIGRRSY